MRCAHVACHICSGPICGRRDDLAADLEQLREALALRQSRAEKLQSAWEELSAPGGEWERLSELAERMEVRAEKAEAEVQRLRNKLAGAESGQTVALATARDEQRSRAERAEAERDNLRALLSDARRLLAERCAAPTPAEVGCLARADLALRAEPATRDPLLPRAPAPARLAGEG